MRRIVIDVRSCRMQTGPRVSLLTLASIALLTLAGCGGSTTPSTPAVHNEWTWVSGANVVNQFGTYGTMGTAAAANTPGARVNAVTWTDKSGDFWLFGGYGRSSAVADEEGDLNDLWNYSGGQWTWVGGSSQTEQPGIYGTKGVAASSNVPGGRYLAVSWTDAQGNFWLFGGLGIDSAGTRGDLNDLWRYSSGQWTWMSGSNLAEQAGTAGANWPGVYGVQGVAASDNVPAARVQASSWSDSSGDLWLFGGEGNDSTASFGELNDLWKYSGGEWTWMAGSNLANQSGTYGTQGTAAPGNTPGSRFGAVTWTDSTGNLWLFGGYGAGSIGNGGELNDLWRYSAGQWTWMGGSNQDDELGTYGTQGVAAPGNMPGARDSAVSWIDAAGNFWLFGGSAPWDYNDLWKYSGGQWTWVSGSNLAGQTGSYGTQGTPAPNNVPGCRNGAVSWTDTFGNLWLFGGDDPITIGCGGGKFNDLWEYQP